MPASTPQESVPQILPVCRMAGNGKVTLKKSARRRIGSGDGAVLHLHLGEEILLSSRRGEIEIPVGRRGDFELPPRARQALSLEATGHLAFVERGEDVALKSIEVTEEPGPHATFLDRESAHHVLRVVVTNPDPEQAIRVAADRYRTERLRYDAAAFVRDRRDLESWCARGVLGQHRASDDDVRTELIEQRSEAQQSDGSWSGEVSATSRALRELAALGVLKGDARIARGATWLLSRPESPHNPGMFFASEQLTALQMEIVEGRNRGLKGRFREIKRSEQKRIEAGDDLIRMPCGPRIMWPNALAVEALIACGFEKKDRVRRALRTISSHEWCECAYQHGIPSQPPSGSPREGEDLEVLELSLIHI